MDQIHSINMYFQEGVYYLEAIEDNRGNILHTVEAYTLGEAWRRLHNFLFYWLEKVKK